MAGMLHGLLLLGSRCGPGVGCADAASGHHATLGTASLYFSFRTQVSTCEMFHTVAESNAQDLLAA